MIKEKMKHPLSFTGIVFAKLLRCLIFRMSYAMHAQGHAYSRQEDRSGAGEVTIATILDNLSKVRWGSRNLV